MPSQLTYNLYRPGFLKSSDTVLFPGFSDEEMNLNTLCSRMTKIFIFQGKLQHEKLKGPWEKRMRS
ncbi:unnamed protein product [Larinioides sclopetarius]|uniref:Uncharacterized protein n=1 Tax=Larinioides sclopetarius TaxID=280406 RepID=A0AAV2BBR7_9ARAC